MLITNHVVAGAVIGSLVRRPAAAFALGIASHVAMDTVPHWGDDGDEALFLKVAVVDGLVGLATMGAITRWSAPHRRACVVAGMLGACFPDSDKPSELFFGRSPFPARVDDLHRRIQNESADRLPREVLTATVGTLVARALARR